MRPQRIERRLMKVGHPRRQAWVMVVWLRRKKRTNWAAIAAAE